MSSSDLAISVRGVAKSYMIAHEANKEESNDFSFTAAVRKRARSGGKREEFWALQGVSMDVYRGDVVGIIGRNGAGKSTLLKVLSRITEPTRGEIDVYGRVGSLLEVGTGMHPELTGRENIFLNGAILGMRKSEIRSKFDEIVDFSGIERFLDTPVKRYSSGMYVRLAFAVAAHLNPEILIVDEVLAVGDSEFQKKCLGKMQDVASHGRTVLFVSHNLTAVQGLCKSAVWLAKGKVKEAGDVGRVCNNYLNEAYSESAVDRSWDDMETAPGDASFRLARARVSVNGPENDVISVSTPLYLEFEYWNLQPDTVLNLSLHVYNETGVMAFNTTSVGEPNWDGRAFPCGKYRTVCEIPAGLLNDGTYRVELLAVKDRGTVVFMMEDSLLFEVVEDPSTRAGWMGKWPGVLRPNLSWCTTVSDGAITTVRQA